MTIHMATPSEIGGSLDTSEVKVLHVSGPFMGMLVVNKLNEPTLDDAIAAGQVMVQEGAVVVPTPPLNMNVFLFNARGQGGPVPNPPAAYPQTIMLQAVMDPAPASPWTALDIEAIHPTGGFARQSINAATVGGPSNTIYSFDLDITEAGAWEFIVYTPDGRTNSASINMLPVA